jgi:UDP-N-acetylglucosamine 2-epimerase (non-hydrolysing)
MLRQALDIFSIRPEYELDSMEPGQTLHRSAAGILSGLGPVLEAEKPDLVLVQGDTTTTLCGALAAFYARIPVGHVEAGLRTYDRLQPFPEEMNRVLTSRLALLHFAATEEAAQALRKEGISTGLAVTGNPGIDALLSVRDRLEKGELQSDLHLLPLDPGKRLIVVTAHRRESFESGIANICKALAELVQRPDVQIVFPVHLNPNVREIVHSALSSYPQILLTEPLTYVDFVDLMRRSYFLLTDSGGVQEEAPSLGKPVLVLREKTERGEAVTAGTARLVGTDPATILQESSLLLDNCAEYRRRSHIQNPYGDGVASRRIATALLNHFNLP